MQVITTYHKVIYVHGEREIGKWRIPCIINEVQNLLILIQTVSIGVRPKIHKIKNLVNLFMDFRTKHQVFHSFTN